MIKKMELKGAQKKVDEFIKQFEEGYWPPLTMLACIIEEVGEVAREINHEYGHKPKRNKEKLQLKLEMGDLLFAMICLANYAKIDLDDALGQTMQKYGVRDKDRWTPKKR
ncbi:nucleotide pyrophosphohydrolase [Candidatus Woesearchaeota archaeon]|nr:nucleotide pyrophosphohydrolase [Candidatus Woesearchaeota archaeon]